MKKSEIEKQLSREFTLSGAESRKILDTIIDSITGMLSDGRRLEVRNFGSFFTKNYKPYAGRNPRTGERVHVAEKKLPHFRASRQVTMELTKRQKGDG